MKLTFIGADHEVTGSAHLLSACGKQILVDYGMEQGRDIYENVDLPIPPSDIDYVLVTHAHIDHTGMLPKLYREGFRGEIFATAATCELTSIMLQDSAHIQEQEVTWKNRKARRSGEPEILPAYTMDDVLEVAKRFQPVDYGQKIWLTEQLAIRFTDVGHLLGSASIEVWVTEEEKERKIVFSGDIGNHSQPLIKDPSYIEEADYVVMESTYGDREHERPADTLQDFADVIQRTFDRGGNVVIPSFAVGRTQEILYFLKKIKEQNLVHGHDGFEVYVDSPLAIEATTIFRRNYEACYDEDALAMVEAGQNPLQFEGLRQSVTSEDSIAINYDPNPKVILSASGMCEAGRVRHHLKHNLWRPESTILFSGYQSNGTLGRALIEGVEEVTLFGERIAVAAEICSFQGISGHADHTGLLQWLHAFKEKPSAVFVVHGEDEVCRSFAEELVKEGYHAHAPYSGSEYDLLAGKFTYVADAVAVQKKTFAHKRAVQVYDRLVAAGKRLMTVIRHNEGGTNKDLSRFTDQINSLCDKWDR